MTEKKYSALGDFVFIRRDEQETDFLGIDIREGAQIENMLGTVTSSGRNDVVTAGDRVHIPHYRVDDYIIDGGEYAVVRDGDLFAKNSDNSFAPINKYVQVRKCQNEHIMGEDGEVSFYHTDKFLETTNWVEIIDVSDDCADISHADIGSFCICPESDEKLQRILYTKDFMLHESLIEFTTEG